MNNQVYPHLDKWQQMQIAVTRNNFCSPASPLRFEKLIFMRFLTENLFTFLLQYTGLMLTSTVSVLNFASGSACAFIFMRGARVLPGIFLGSYCAYYLATHHFFFALKLASLDAMQAFGLLFLNYRCKNPTLIFANKKSFAIFCFIAFLLTCCISLIHAPINFLAYWLCNLNGILILGTAIISWDFYFPDIGDIKKSFLPFSLLTCLCLLLILNSSPLSNLSSALLIFLLSITISLKFKWCGTIGSASLIGLLLNIAALLQTPLFTTPHAFYTVFYLQLILLSGTTLGLALNV